MPTLVIAIGMIASAGVTALIAAIVANLAMLLPRARAQYRRIFGVAWVISALLMFAAMAALYENVRRGC